MVPGSHGTPGRRSAAIDQPTCPIQVNAVMMKLPFPGGGGQLMFPYLHCRRTLTGHKLPRQQNVPLPPGSEQSQPSSPIQSTTSGSHGKQLIVAFVLSASLQNNSLKIRPFGPKIRRPAERTRSPAAFRDQETVYVTLKTVWAELLSVMMSPCVLSAAGSVCARCDWRRGNQSEPWTRTGPADPGHHQTHWECSGGSGEPASCSGPRGVTDQHRPTSD